MAYLTFEEYTAYGGDLPEAAFTLEEFKARKQIDYWTANRVASMAAVPEEVKLCMVAIMKYNSRFSASAQIDTPVVASFNTDGYSESYGSVDAQATSAKRELSALVVQMLCGVTDDEDVPLLYRGLDL